MKKTFSFLKIGAVVALLPMVAFAQNAFSLLGTIQAIINVVMPILIGIAVIYLIVAVVQYVIAGDEEKKAEGRSHMIYGIIGLFVIVAIWGLVGVLMNTFSLNNQTTLQNNFPVVCPPGQTWQPNLNPPKCQ